MLRFLASAYALAAYALGVAVLALFGAFLLDFDFLARAVPPAGTALAVDLALVALFAVQHTVMARPGFKAAWTRVVPRAVERSTYVLVSAVALGVLLFAWQPIEGVVWQATGVGALLLYATFALGGAILFGATFMIDHLALFGLRQAWRAGDPADGPGEFRVVLLYRLVRHPIMLGFLIMLWGVPRMTLDHLALALGFTAYILVALRFEERDLVEEHGEDYRRYQREVPSLVPLRGAAARNARPVLRTGTRSGS